MRQPSRAIPLLCIGLVPLVGSLDVWTGDEMGFVPFYLIPVLLGAWYGGRGVGLSVAGACVVSGVVADDLLGRHGVAAPWIAAWNAVAWLVVYVVVAMAIAALRDNVARLQQAFAEIKTLEGLLPMCAWCKRIRDGEDWQSVETYVSEHSKAAFTHGICPDCAADMLRRPG